MNSNGRAGSGTIYRNGDAPSQDERFAAVARKLTLFLKDNRKLWPAMCQALQAIVAGDDQSDSSNSAMGEFSLDTARHISTKQMDCLAKVDRLIPPSKYRDSAVYYARRYCGADRAQECWRLKWPGSTQCISVFGR